MGRKFCHFYSPMFDHLQRIVDVLFLKFFHWSKFCICYYTWLLLLLTPKQNIDLQYQNIIHTFRFWSWIELPENFWNENWENVLARRKFFLNRNLLLDFASKIVPGSGFVGSRRHAVSSSKNTCFQTGPPLRRKKRKTTCSENLDYKFHPQYSLL
jgi:hypothetical protein